MNAEAYLNEWQAEGSTIAYTTWLENRLSQLYDQVAIAEKALWERALVAADGDPIRQQLIYKDWLRIGATLKGQDNCQKCRGAKGGVRGNENIVDGVILCDYCTVEVESCTQGKLAA